jgi:hypothetical protein
MNQDRHLSFRCSHKIAPRLRRRYCFSYCFLPVRCKARNDLAVWGLVSEKGAQTWCDVSDQFGLNGLEVRKLNRVCEWTQSVQTIYFVWICGWEYRPSWRIFDRARPWTGRHGHRIRSCYKQLLWVGKRVSFTVIDVQYTLAMLQGVVGEGLEFNYSSKRDDSLTVRYWCCLD